MVCGGNSGACTILQEILHQIAKSGFDMASKPSKSIASLAHSEH